MAVKITYFVHGTTTDNENNLCTGWNGGVLSERGQRENIQLSETLKDKKFDAVFTSDLKRATDTVKTVFPNQQVIIDKRLREENYGDLNDKHESEFQNYDYYINHQHPNGESLKDVEMRIADFLSFLKNNYDGKHVAILAHKAPQLAIEVLLNNKSWLEAIQTDWRQTKSWQPGWEYWVK